MNKTKVLDVVKKYTMILMLVLVTLVFQWGTGGKLLKPQNLSNLIAQNAYVFVLATGMLLCILTGGNIDLSIGSVVCFVGAVGVSLMEKKNLNMFAAIGVMIVIGILIGAWQGFWIAFVKIPPFITTLAGMLIFRGLSNVVLEGMTVAIKSETFISLFGGGKDCYFKDFLGTGQGLNITCLVAGIVIAVIYVLIQVFDRVSKQRKGYTVEALTPMIIKTVLIVAVLVWFFYQLANYKGIPTVLAWVVAIILIYGYITSNTTIGRYFYAVGGNQKATELSGINTKMVFFRAYTNMGFLAAIAGMITVARMTSAQPTYGQNYEMDAIGSCFIGGASAYGGIGTVPGVIVGALLMGIINQGMSIMGVDMNWQKVIKGLVLLAAVIFDVVSKKENK